MKINSLKLETSTGNIYVPTKSRLIVDKTDSEGSINLKKENEHNYKAITKFEYLLQKEIDKLK